MCVTREGEERGGDGDKRGHVRVYLKHKDIILWRLSKESWFRVGITLSEHDGDRNFPSDHRITDLHVWSSRISAKLLRERRASSRLWKTTVGRISYQPELTLPETSQIAPWDTRNSQWFLWQRWTCSPSCIPSFQANNPSCLKVRHRDPDTN